MPVIIDKELEKAAKLGLTPKTIYVGTGLYNEIRDEQFGPFATESVSAASSFPTEEPTEYRGIKIHLVEDKEPDYLSIET